MECKKIQKLLPLYIGSDIEGKKQQKIKDHLSQCENCKKYANVLSRSNAVAGKALSQTIEASALTDMWPQVHAEIVKQEERLQQYDRRFKAFELVFASAVLVIAVLCSMIGLHRPKKHVQDELLYTSAQQEKLSAENFPLVEDVDMPGVTVLTMETNDPHIKVVWFLDD